MIGKKLRCPNPDCKKVFTVHEAPPEAPSSKGKSPPAGAKKPASPPPPSRAATGFPVEVDWAAAPPPPVRRKGPDDAVEPPEAAPVDRASPDEVLAWMHGPAEPAGDAKAPGEEVFDEWTVVEGGDDRPHDAAADRRPAPDESPVYHIIKPKRSQAKFVLVAIVLVAAAGGFGFFKLYQTRKATEERLLAEQADKTGKEQRFDEAAKQFDQLANRFTGSSSINRYRFLAAFYKARSDAGSLSVDPLKRFEDFRTYFAEAQKDKEYKKDEHGPIAGEALLSIARELANLADKARAAKDVDGAEKGVAAVEPVMQLMEKLSPKSGDEVRDTLAKIKDSIAAERKLIAFLKKVDEILSTPSLGAIEQVRADAKQAGYSDNPEVLKRLEQADQIVQKSIRFVAEEAPPLKLPTPELPSLLIGPAGGPMVPGAENEGPVFAVARGVLYALGEITGRVMWATRVGIDVQSLPLRVPGSATTPELVLVPAADGAGITARESRTGKPRWHQALPAPLRGQPVLVGRRAFMPLADDRGTVLVIEIVDGHRIGKLEAGRKLGPGAARQPGGQRIFLPADGNVVLVIEPEHANPNGNIEPACTTVLKTDHPVGSLRGEPLVFGGADDPGYLVLGQTEGIGQMRLRVFRLALPSPTLTQVAETKLNGWSWFPPVSDLEKVAVVTDAGSFTLFGVNQKNNLDTGLFPILSVDPPAAAAGAPARGMVAHAVENSFWVLANGDLNLYRIGFDRKDGLRNSPGWARPLQLGTPLHPAQTNGDSDVLYLVTQQANPPICLATAVDAQNGAIRWQRPLSLTAQGDPIVIGGQIVQMDQGGGLYQVDPAQINVRPDVEWYLGGTQLFPSRTDVVGEPAILTSADGNTAFAILVVADGKQLLVREVSADKPPQERSLTVPAALAGAPALAGTSLVIPLSDGTLHRVPIGGGAAAVGPDWKGQSAGPETKGFVLALPGDEFLTSDGQRALSTWSWPANNKFQKRQSYNLPDRMVGRPLMLPGEKETARIVVAEAIGRITLLDTQLAPVQTWAIKALQLGNEITAGPFILELPGKPAQIAVIMDRVKLALFRPGERQAAMVYQSAGEGFSGRPIPVGDRLILADISGRFESVGVVNGKATGVRFPAEGGLPAAPAAAPVPFGPNRLYAPLSDGTILLLPRDRLASAELAPAPAKEGS